MKVAVWIIASVIAMPRYPHAAESDGIDASRAIVQHIAGSSASNQTPQIICVSAAASEQLPTLIDQLRDVAPFIRPSAECRSSPSHPPGKRLWIRLGPLVKEAEGVFLQSADYDSSMNCVFRVRRDNSGQWKVSISTPCAVS